MKMLPVVGYGYFLESANYMNTLLKNNYCKAVSFHVHMIIVKIDQSAIQPIVG